MREYVVSLTIITDLDDSDTADAVIEVGTSVDIGTEGYATYRGRVVGIRVEHREA